MGNACPRCAGAVRLEQHIATCLQCGWQLDES